MKSFQIATFFRKNSSFWLLKSLQSVSKKRIGTIVFLLLLALFYVNSPISKVWNDSLVETTIAMDGYGEQLESNLNSTANDTVILKKERVQLLRNIEEKLVAYLYQIPDYSYIAALETYLEYAPMILEQIPSTVPLEKGDYWLSSEYGVRKHPIFRKRKKHFGIDLAATSDRYVYASASGTVLSITHSQKGYGTHIIIKHRFGFETLYGHLNKVLVSEGQTVAQHELIATVGTTGSSTGFHLHYEVVKNGIKIDPIYSLNLKRKIYKNLFRK
ncbi:M23 family metallopeptidase [Ulvibacterium marinum]|uniref:M23 family metallopeptidase n=1 Tax=Ulvibacterium marinum TaxID=2419782 RepID=A0A3B0CEI1_9FLAO|nr:M23 family metallopeptidase [Ulvibacterium marinum]RKN83511.1 M23 family metallopeptidase [Ulvibacterium marinum]